MKNFDLFESYKSNTRNPLIAELKVVNSEPVFTYDEYQLFENPRLTEEWRLELPWKPRSAIFEYTFVRGVFFHNGILIEEHHLSLPLFNAEACLFWWKHNYIKELTKGLNVKFYGR